MADCIVCTGANVKQMLPALIEYEASNDCWYWRVYEISAFTCEGYTCNSEQDFWNMFARTIFCACDGRPAIRIAITTKDADNELTQVCSLQTDDFWKIASLAFVTDTESGELAINMASICGVARGQ